MKYFIGQRVLVNNSAIGIVCVPQNQSRKNDDLNIWVNNPEKGYPSCYDAENIKPLPNGQL